MVRELPGVEAQKLESAKAGDAATAPETVTVLASADETLSALSNMCAWATDLKLAYAWASSGAGKAPHWTILPLEKISKATIGIQFAQTEPEFLRQVLKRRGEALKVVEDTGGVFHPKIIVATNGADVRALVGSSNFTAGGFGGNTELNLLVSGSVTALPLKRLVAFVDEQWTHPRAFTPDGVWLARYGEAYDNRPRPKPLQAPSPSRRLVRSLSDINVTWDAYYRVIQAQERRALANGYEIHVFDHPSFSYLQEIELCSEYFRTWPSLERMPLDERKLVAGFGGTSGYFGRMGGAGYYKNMIIERPREIGRLLDRIPTRSDPSESQILEYLDGAQEIKGVGFATATRLLVAKRPDLFLSVNSASRGRIRQVFGSVPASPKAYVGLLRRIWDLPWFSAPEPASTHERRVWRARVAILDAALYETAAVGGGPG